MSLQITEKNGVFHLNGRINNATIAFFKTYFKHNLAQTEKIIINIEQVAEINKSGLAMLNHFMKIANNSQKHFAITGYGCKEIYDHFNTVNVA